MTTKKRKKESKPDYVARKALADSAWGIASRRNSRDNAKRADVAKKIAR